MDGNILFFPQLSPAVPHAEWIQTPTEFVVKAGKICKIHTSLAFIQRCTSVFRSAYLAAHQAAQRERWSSCDLCPAALFSLHKYNLPSPVAIMKHQTLQALFCFCLIQLRCSRSPNKSSSPRPRAGFTTESSDSFVWSCSASALSVPLVAPLL